MVRSEHRADLLCNAIDKAGSPLFVGIDPVASRLPQQLSRLPVLDGFQAFSKGIIDAVATTTAAVKFQSACFERYGSRGVKLLAELRLHAAEAGLVVIQHEQ